MTASPSILRPLLIAVIGTALLTQGGCVWLRAKFANTAVYEDSDQANPLEVPPDLDAPNTTAGIAIPDVTANPVTQGSTATATVPAIGGDGFAMADTVDSAFRRVGVALGKIDGVTLGDSAQATGTHTVTYQGTTMQIRVEAAGDGARVSAVGTDGTPLTGGPAGALLAALKARLG